MGRVGDSVGSGAEVPPNAASRPRTPPCPLHEVWPPKARPLFLSQPDSPHCLPSQDVLDSDEEANLARIYEPHLTFESLKGSRRWLGETLAQTIQNSFIALLAKAQL